MFLCYKHEIHSHYQEFLLKTFILRVNFKATEKIFLKQKNVGLLRFVYRPSLYLLFFPILEELNLLYIFKDIGCLHQYSQEYLLILPKLFPFRI